MSEARLSGIGACVFDAYGTLFDVNAAAQRCAAELGESWHPLAEVWRAKQLQYTWLRTLMNRYVDFWQITGDALDVALETVGIDDAAMRQRLLDLYLTLDCYREVPDVLGRLKAAGMKTAVLSNGSPKMLNSAVANAGLSDLLDAVISIDGLGLYKPRPEVYQLGVETLGIEAPAISFQSSNSWDAHGASAFGFKVVWINRFGQARERLPGNPDVEIRSLDPLPGIVGVET